MSDSITNHDLPLGMEVRHLAALQAIAETKSFSQAAAQLGYAQSAVSQQIATLERTVGHKLVERPGGPRPVSLTPAGVVLLRHASHITARLGAVKADLDALAAGEAATLRVGTFQSASSRLLPPIIARYRDQWPHITVELHSEQASPVLEDLVRAGQVDLAFTDSANLTPPLLASEIIEDPYVVMVHPDSPLASLDEIDLRHLNGERLISGSTINTCEMRVRGLLDRTGADPHIVFRSDDNLTTQRLVAAGLAVAVVPLLAVELFVPDSAVTVLPIIESQRMSRHIQIVWHRDRYRSHASEAFVETAIAVGHRIGLPKVPVVTSKQGAATLLV